MLIKFGKEQFRMTSNDKNKKQDQTVNTTENLGGEMLTTCPVCQVPNAMGFRDEHYNRVNLKHTIHLNQ